MANITTWVIAGLAIGALTASILRSDRIGVNLIGGAVICSIGGLLVTTQTNLDASTFSINLLGMIVGGVAARLFLAAHAQSGIRDH